MLVPLPRRVIVPALHEDADQPGRRLEAFRLVGPYGIGVLQRQADIVQPFDQAALSVRIDVGMPTMSFRSADLSRSPIRITAKDVVLPVPSPGVKFFRFGD